MKKGDETMNTHSGKKGTTDALPGRPGIRTLVMAAATAFLLSGCFGGQAGRTMQQYALEYTPEVPQGVAMLPETLTVDKFTAAQLYSTTAMVYQEEPYQRNQYSYHRWRVNPADLVADSLLRDLRNAGMFRGVFQHRSSEPSRYLLTGDVEEFREYDDQEGRWALVSLNVTLLDTSRQALPDRLLFQKNYRIVEPIDEKIPAGLAKGMSQAVAKVSGLLMDDIFRIVRETRNKGGK
jgi:cholesterol transport system auxiliary component